MSSIGFRPSALLFDPEKAGARFSEITRSVLQIGCASGSILLLSHYFALLIWEL